MNTVHCFGEALIDFHGTPTDPAPTFTAHAGGAPANVAVAIARLGGRAAFVGMFGQDMFGDLLLRGLADAGVDTACTRRTDAANTALAEVVFPGSTAMSHLAGESAKEPNTQIPVWSMASLPSLNRLVSKSVVPWPCSIVGITVPLLSTSHLAASMPAGVLKAAFLPSLLRKLAPFCTRVL